MSELETFINAIRNCTSLPECVLASAHSAAGVETSSFDASYLEFLDEQIELNARGDAWSQRLRSRRCGFADWCDIPLIGGRIMVNADDYTVKVDPKTQTVVYWEHYADCR